jgi:sulfur relay (sulfurtransferase) complex TusBCD TusD component (DsrE family)
MSARTYDFKCWELACHFLANEPTATDDDRRQLARDLQQTAEDALYDMSCCQMCSATRGMIGAECDGKCFHAKRSA